MCFLLPVFSVYQPTPLIPPSGFWILPGLTVAITFSLVQIIVSSHGLLRALFTSRPLFQLSKAKFFHCNYSALQNYKSLTANFYSKHLSIVHHEQSLALISTDSAPSLFFQSVFPSPSLFHLALLLIKARHFLPVNMFLLVLGAIISIGYRIILSNNVFCESVRLDLQGQGN